MCIRDRHQCSETYPINLKLVPTPIVAPSINNALYNICDINNDAVEPYNLTQHEPQIYSGTDPVTFSYYRSYNDASQTFSGLISDPANFLAAPNTTVYAKIQFNTGGCFSVSKINIQMTFLPTIVLHAATPVSYTHLDVYKRQTIIGKFFSAAAIIHEFSRGLS